MEYYGLTYMKAVFGIITIMLIVTIILVNMIFIWQERNHFLKEHLQVRYCVKIGIAISNVVIALFSMVVNVIKLLDDSLDCGIFRIALSYQLHYCSLVYSLAFIILAVELALRSSCSKSFASSKWNKSFNINLALSLFPWVASLLIASPISLAHIKWEDGCVYKSLEHMRITLLVCMVAPVAIALISCCFLFAFTAARAKSQSQTTKTIGGKVCHLNTFETIVPTTYEFENGPSSPTPARYASQYANGISFSALVPPQRNPEKPYETLQVSTKSDQCIIRKERIVLLCSSVILFFTVVPLPLFSVGYIFNVDTNQTDRDTNNIVSNSLYTFFLCTHSLFVPLIWLSFTKL